jgi:trigger factor
MKTSELKKLNAGRAQSTVTFEPSDMAQAEEKALEKMGKTVRIEGFRPGHVPAHILREKVNPEMLFEQTLRSLLPEAFEALMKEHSLRPIIPPTVDVTSKDPLTITVTFVEAPEASVKHIDSLKIPKKDIKVEEKDIERMVKYLLEQQRVTSEVERAAKEGDQVTLDFVGTDKEGKEVPGTRSEGYPVVIGSKTLIPGFEDNLKDLKKGDQKSFTLTFPEKYHAEHLRNQPVTFSVTAKKVEEVSLPELTDEFVQKHQIAGSAKELRTNIENSLKQEEENLSQRQRENELFDLIRKNTKVELAPELVNFELKNMIEELYRQLDEQKMTMDQWLQTTGKTAEAIDKELREESERRLTLRFGIEKILEEKKIDVTDEEMDTLVKNVIAVAPANERPAMEHAYSKGHQEYEQLKWQRKIEKMMDMLLA